MAQAVMLQQLFLMVRPEYNWLVLRLLNCKKLTLVLCLPTFGGREDGKC